MSALNPVFTVCDQISDALRTNLGLSKKAARERVVELLSLVGIPSPRRRLDSYVHEFSGGMRQRVMLAMALSCNPNFLIADEPTTALDVTIQATILELITSMIERFDMSLIFITHNLGVVGQIAQRALVMYAGEVTEALPVASLFRDARMPYTRALLRSVPRLGGRKGARLAAIPGAPPNVSTLPPGCAFHPRCEHQLPGRCDTDHPALDAIARDHAVRCLRWRDIPVEATP
jgi:oligopeptide/dipeptide ABC transporter ATP-binding protein